MNPAVLIVDDEKNVRQSLKRLLRPEGYDLHLAEGGPAALEILAKTEIAVIICDQRMPEMSGTEVLAEAYRLRPAAVRITLTGYTDLLAAQASINEGHVSHFLFKPWNDEHLRSVVRQSVEAYRLVQENQRLESLTRRQNEELQTWNHRLEEQVRLQTQSLQSQNDDLRRLRDRLDDSLRDTVKLVAAMLEVHSPNLGIHSRRVAELCRALGERQGLEGEALRDVEFAAHLHDIGDFSKSVGEASVQTRSGWNARSSHPAWFTEAGCALLSQVSGFERVAKAVRHQHENFDGSGSPDGLRQDEIPLASRILAVVNAYDRAVFSAARPTVVSHQAGCDALRQGQGKRFDPQLVDQLLRHFTETGLAGRNGMEVEISSRKIRPGMVLARPVYNLMGSLVLKEDTRLSPDLIERLQKLADVDPRSRSVFVRCMPSDEDGSPGSPASDKRRPDSDAPAESPPASRHKVLMVDDSALLCNALKRELRPEGIEVVATQSGWDALNLIEKDRFDAVLVDLMMPAMPGEELVARLEQRQPAIPCLILTGNATKDRVLSLAQRSNVAAILVKPWDRDRLISSLTGAIAKSHA